MISRNSGSTLGPMACVEVYGTGLEGPNSFNKDRYSVRFQLGLLYN